MEVVVNTSIIISALLKEGLTRKMIFFSPFELYSLPYAREEIEKHRTELITKSKLDENAYQYLLDSIFSKLRIVEADALKPYESKAVEVMKDIDIGDSPFIALALYLDCPIWSNDGHFKHQNIIKTYTTEELLRLLQKEAV
ncbi:MAG: hypothetical protein COT13_06040 [Chloroflexi bacterium CG08_land_8_20_14_0_20_45_12]|nr:MAG: hypothetical protein COT13_06040 [Chloroflexi bacterium CG08_land_8_20_14_0_20_45_12]PIX27669.1 MAG: hypothetical protein COZ67_01060 [Chloroflexi bacterium CG_4_8_14_3_um_filter_45_15]